MLSLRNGCANVFNSLKFVDPAYSSTSSLTSAGMYSASPVHLIYSAHLAYPSQSVCGASERGGASKGEANDKLFSLYFTRSHRAPLPFAS